MLLRHAGFRRLCEARERLREVSDPPMSVAAIAAELGVSPFHFSRQFEAVFGRTPHQFRIEARLQLARERLARGESVTDTCMEVGFSSLGSFSTLFTCRVGEAPSAYRRRIWALGQTSGDLPAELAPGCLSLMSRLPASAFR